MFVYSVVITILLNVTTQETLSRSLTKYRNHYNSVVLFTPYLEKVPSRQGNSVFTMYTQHLKGYNGGKVENFGKRIHRTICQGLKLLKLYQSLD